MISDYKSIISQGIISLYVQLSLQVCSKSVTTEYTKLFIREVSGYVVKFVRWLI